MLPALRELGIGLVAYSPLGRGFLTGRPSRREDFGEGDFRRHQPRFQGENFAAQPRARRARAASWPRARRALPGQLALAWVMHRGDDVVPIPGTKRRPYLEENVAATELDARARTICADRGGDARRARSPATATRTCRSSTAERVLSARRHVWTRPAGRAAGRTRSRPRAPRSSCVSSSSMSLGSSVTISRAPSVSATTVTGMASTWTPSGAPKAAALAGVEPGGHALAQQLGQVRVRGDRDHAGTEQSRGSCCRAPAHRPCRPRRRRRAAAGAARASRRSPASSAGPLSLLEQLRELGDCGAQPALVALEPDIEVRALARAPGQLLLGRALAGALERRPSRPGVARPPTGGSRNNSERTCAGRERTTRRWLVTRVRGLVSRRTAASRPTLALAAREPRAASRWPGRRAAGRRRSTASAGLT